MSLKMRMQCRYRAFQEHIKAILAQVNAQNAELLSPAHIMV